jgi:hypothetical protein
VALETEPSAIAVFSGTPERAYAVRGPPEEHATTVAPAISAR